MERCIWRWEPSPQSNSRRSPPTRASRQAVARRAVGTEPPVPRKTTERSMPTRYPGAVPSAGGSCRELERQRLAHELRELLASPTTDLVVGCKPHAPFLVIAGGVEAQPALGSRNRADRDEEYRVFRWEVNAEHVGKTNVRPTALTMICRMR